MSARTRSRRRPARSVPALVVALAATGGLASGCGGPSRAPLDARAQAPARAATPPDPQPAAGGARSAVTTSSMAFASARDRVLDELLTDDPSTARDLGLHAYDGKVAPISAEATSARIARLRRAAANLDAIA